MFETHNTDASLWPSIESMNDAVTTLWQRYEPNFSSEEIERLREQSEERVARIARKIWRDLPDGETEVTYAEILSAYDAEYDL